MTLYCDSSAIVSIYVRERGRHRVVQPLLQREPAACTSLGYLEVHAALTRARFRDNPRRLSGRNYERAVEQFEADWPNYFRIPASEGLLHEASRLTRIYLLRAYDALHLASALAIKQLVPDTVMISTWDPALATAARAEGIPLAHEVTT